jgi:hypothetical protein
MITLFVGDNQEYLAHAAKKNNTAAVLIDHVNWQKILQQSNSGTFYTSLSDLPKIDDQISVCWELMQWADSINYVEPTTWSDADRNFSWTNQKTLLEYYLYLQKKSGKLVLGFDTNSYKDSPYLNLEAQRASPLPAVWIGGCSVPHGIGVEKNQRFGHLIEQGLDRPTYHLTRPGSSVEWAADQLLRSDIHPTDIVVWGLTQEVRAPRAVDLRIDSWGDQTAFDVEYLMDETRFYKALTSVYQVINFCSKIGCQLLLLPTICSEKLIMSLIHRPELISLPYQANFVDLGTDNVHPGPEQHRIWAEHCLNIINQHLAKA